MPAIEIVGVQKRYPKLQALNNIRLTIEEGEFFGLLGPNGAGKTTLIHILAGLTRADGGIVRVCGQDVVSSFRAARRTLGVVPQELVFDPFFTVRETLRIQSGYYGFSHNEDWIDEVIANLGLTAKADANMRTLSGGMKRRVLIAQALMHRPAVIVLDEPTAGVDVELRQTLWKFIGQLNRAGHTIVLTTHYLEEAEQLCTRIAMLQRGEIVALDRTRALLQRASGIQLALRIRRGSLPSALDARLIHPAETSGTSIRDEWHRLRLDRYEEVEPILAQCRAAGCVLDEIEICKADLEEVFMQIMHPSPHTVEARI